MLKLSIVLALIPLAACAPSDQADSGDETFAPSNTSRGVVPSGAPGQGAGTAITDGETSARGAVDAADSPTSAPGSTGHTGRPPH